MTKSRWKTTFILVLAGLLILPALAPAAGQSGGRISRPGEYQGYSEPIYDEWARTSVYIPVRDGTRLAADIFRPAVDGEPVTDPLPVVWTHHRYHRTRILPDGTLFTILDQAPDLRTLLEYGYIVAAVDVRGGGASFGTRRGEFSPEETQDAFDVTEWFAEQPWSTGSIGMYGLSYLGITQYLAASTHPPHLKAIFPMMAMFDLYTFAYPGGVFNENFVKRWGGNTLALDKLIPAPPVDDDPDSALRDAAQREHRDNANIYTLASANPYRDSRDNDLNEFAYTLLSPSSYVDAINTSRVAVYTLGGWYDMYPRDAVTWFNNLTVPQKLILTPWSHNGSGGFDLILEHVRWFDYWLKGIDNGIMEEPPIYYSVMGTDTTWHFASEWPLPETQYTPFYFQAGPSGSVESANDGILTGELPAETNSQNDYTVDYTTTTGTTTRWTDGFGGGYGYPNMHANDEESLTYTTPPLDSDVQVTGHPVVHLWVTSTADDGDFYVYLEEVNEFNVSTYLTEGVLRAAHRATHTPPYHYMGLPYHRSYAEDSAPLPAGEPVELVFDLQPTSNIFEAGHRIRVSITGADADNFEVIELGPPPTVSIYRSAEYPSHIVLPIIPAQ